MLRFLLTLGSLIGVASVQAADRPPNVVLVFADDLGYADLGCFGAKNWKTLHLDGLAKQGIRFTDFHSSQPVCSASRTSLLTGCYANRLGIHGALGPNARHGIADTEVTLAELCKSKGYATGMAGKWHLGHHPQFLPTRHGFDEYFGLPYSNDMWPHHPEAKKGSYPNLPLIEGEKVIDDDVTPEDQATLTARYTERAVKFIERNKERPFFFYLAHNMPHVPLFVGEKFRGKSGSVYGDVIQEIDWSVGEVLAALKKHDLEKNTLVIFTSDNGPWLSYGNHGGSAGPLREGKGTVYEGGTRVPFVARWPGVIPANATQTEPTMTIDLLPTIAKLIGAELPKHPIDGKDIGALLRNEPGAKCPHDAYYHYFAQGELQAIRSGRWKMMLPHTSRTMMGQAPGKDGTPGRYKQEKVEGALYDLQTDLGETTDVSAANADMVKRMMIHAEYARAELGDALTKRVGKGVREPGRLAVNPSPGPSPKRGGEKDGSPAPAPAPPPRFREGAGTRGSGDPSELRGNPSPGPSPKRGGEKDIGAEALPFPVLLPLSVSGRGLGGGVNPSRSLDNFPQPVNFKTLTPNPSPEAGEGDRKLTAELVFPLNPKHNHAPGIVECPNGDLFVSWYRGSGERSADDVAVYGARLKKGSNTWGEAHLLVDTPGFPDCNTTMFIDPKGKLWLFWPVILANSWESCLTHYRVSSDYQGDGAPKWEWQGNIPLKPLDFEAVMLKEFPLWKDRIEKLAGATIPKALGDDYVKQRVADKLLSRLGWQPRCKPVVLKSGRWLLPLYSDTYSAGLMAISDDAGKTWTASKPLAGFGSIQPAVLERADGSLVAYMRENGVFKKIRVSESKDQGVTWGTVGALDLPNPGSGLDAVRLANGHWALIYNDTLKGRASLAVSLSDDEGKTWKWTRHLEKHATGSYHYPAIIQAKDGAIHAIYSYFVEGGKSMKHARFTEDWVKEGDK